MPQFVARVNMDSHDGTIRVATDGATVTFDCGKADKHTVTLGGNRTFALTGDTDGQTILIIPKQDATGGRTGTFWSGILWPGGTVPTLTATAGKYDVFSFVRLSSGVYLGFAVGMSL
jgi:hypothetical protein